MKNYQTNGTPAVPTAHICINKSKLKIYNKETDPTFYLENGQEFQIELFNPTQITVLAKIKLNNNLISQGGLVLKPGERVFLERYLDVARKFLFEIYEVSNTSQVKEAIRNNGDFEVEFFNETIPVNFTPITIITTYPYYKPFEYNNGWENYNADISYKSNDNTSERPSSYFNNTVSVKDFNNIGSYTPTNLNSSVTTDSLSFSNERLEKKLNSSKKTIETGRVEAGSESNQQVTYVNKSFNYYPSHRVSYKMLPISQKINDSSDIKIAQYCTKCGTKQKPEFKFCPTCGMKK
jgi:hypothetical protein